MVSPKIVPAYCMKCFQVAVQGARTQIEHDIEGRAETSGKPRCLGFVGQNNREEKAACKEESHLERKFQRPSECLPQVFGMRVKKLPEARKRIVRNEWAEQFLELTQGWQ